MDPFGLDLLILCSIEAEQALIIFFQETTLKIMICKLFFEIKLT